MKEIQLRSVIIYFIVLNNSSSIIASGKKEQYVKAERAAEIEYWLGLPISKTIGISASVTIMVKLGLSMGGARVYVSAKAAHDHPLTLVLGESTAQKLCDDYCGDMIEVACKSR